MPDNLTNNILGNYASFKVVKI